MRIKLLPIILALLFQLNSASAQDELTESQIAERLRYIQQKLEQGKPRADLWWRGWLIGYSAATVGQGTIGLISEDKDTRQDMSLGAATTLLGAMGQIIAPMPPSYAPDQLGDIPESTPAERKEKLLKAEKLLKECAQRERDGRSWKAHAIAGVVNLGSGIVVWRGFKKSAWEGFGNFALNTAITEAQIWTQPTRAMQDYRDYFTKYETGKKLGCRSLERRWFVTMYPGGFNVSVKF